MGQGFILGHRQRISTHALREEGDNPLATSARPVSSFLPTPSARRATSLSMFQGFPVGFLPTPSARRATSLLPLWFGGAIFLPTPSARRATS